MITLQLQDIVVIFIMQFIVTFLAGAIFTKTLLSGIAEVLVKNIPNSNQAYMKDNDKSAEFILYDSGNNDDNQPIVCYNRDTQHVYTMVEDACGKTPILNVNLLRDSNGNPINIYDWSLGAVGYTEKGNKKNARECNYNRKC